MAANMNEFFVHPLANVHTTDYSTASRGWQVVVMLGNALIGSEPW